MRSVVGLEALVMLCCCGSSRPIVRRRVIGGQAVHAELMSGRLAEGAVTTP